MFPWFVTGLLLVGLAAALISLRLTTIRLREARTRHLRLAAQVQDQTALKARLAGMIALGQASYGALILVNSSHTLIHMNAVAHDLFVQPGDHLPSAPPSLIAVTRHHELADIVDAALSGHEGVDWQLTIRNRPYRVRAMRTETELGPYAALVLEDVSELRRLERARRDMVANISHELRTPITSIRLLSDTLLRGALRDRERATGLLEKITSETDTLQQMAQELLDLSMIESGMTLVRLVPVELSELIAAAVDHLSEQAHRKGLSIEGQSPPHLQVLADPEQIGRVLTNLLHNAIKFTPEGGIVEISVELDQEWATVAVTDTGPGIPEHERERVFERFYRGDQARTGPGTGLGLAIAKHIVEAHGGRIWAEESPTPPGARLCFTLPTAER